MLLFAIQVIGDDRLKPLIFLALPLVVVVSKVMGLYERDVATHA